MVDLSWVDDNCYKNRSLFVLVVSGSSVEPAWNLHHWLLFPWENVLYERYLQARIETNETQYSQVSNSWTALGFLDSEVVFENKYERTCKNTYCRIMVVRFLANGSSALKNSSYKGPCKSGEKCWKNPYSKCHDI